MTHREQADWKSQAIEKHTFTELVELLEERYPGKVRRTIEVCPTSIIKTIDNEVDARATIANLLLARKNNPISVKHSSAGAPLTALDLLARVNAHRPKLWQCPACHRRCRVENAPNHADECQPLRRAAVKEAT